MTAFPDSTSRKLQLEFSPQAYGRLRSIRDLAKVETNALAITNALRLYEWFLSERSSGTRFLVERNGKITEVNMGLL